EAGQAARQSRDDLVSASSRLSEIVSRSGADHPEAVGLAAQMERLRERLAAQLRVIHQQLVDTLSVASRRVEYLNKQLADATLRNLADGHKMIELANLERFAESYRSLF